MQSDGDLIVPYYDEDRVAAVRSSDGGRSFSPPVTVAPTRFRAPPLPSAEVDGSGTIYVAWPDCGAACERDDIVVSSSADGISWSRPRRLPLGRGADFVIPGLAADATHPGRVAVTYYAYKPTQFLDVGIVTSTDGGRRWSVPRRLSVRTMQLRWIAQAGGAMVGDYISTSWAGNRAVAVFALASPRRGAQFDQPLFATAIRP